MSNHLKEAQLLADDFNQAIVDRYGSSVRMGTVLEGAGILLTTYIMLMPEKDRLLTIEQFAKMLRDAVGEVEVTQ